jgi:hypothetical protein
MKRLVALAVAALLVALVSCRKEMAVEESRAAAPAGPAAGAPADQPKAAPAGAPVANRAPAIPRKLVRTVDLELEVKSPEETAARVQALVAGLGGYVASAATQRRNDLLEYTLALRVPVERFEEAVKAVRAMGVRVDRESQKVEDVTDQYIDLDARMRTLEATEGELRGLLAESRQRGRKVAEIMEIYRQLVEIRSQIEQIHAQLNSFDKLAALSTLNLDLVPTEAAKPVTGDAWHPSDTVRSSFRSLVVFLKALMDFLIWAVIVLVPIVLVLGGLIWAVLRAGRWLRRLRDPAAAAPPDGSDAGPSSGRSAGGN